MFEIGKTLILLGAVILAAGVALTLLGRVPWLGRLPGDVVIRRDNFVFVFPLATCIIASVVLSVVLYWLRR
jgi:uncharacterized protein HemY